MSGTQSGQHDVTSHAPAPLTELTHRRQTGRISAQPDCHIKRFHTQCQKYGRKHFSSTAGLLCHCWYLYTTSVWNERFGLSFCQWNMCQPLRVKIVQDAEQPLLSQKSQVCMQVRQKKRYCCSFPCKRCQTLPHQSKD